MSLPTNTDGKLLKSGHIWKSLLPLTSRILIYSYYNTFHVSSSKNSYFLHIQSFHAIQRLISPVRILGSWVRIPLNAWICVRVRVCHYSVYAIPYVLIQGILRNASAIKKLKMRPRPERNYRSINSVDYDENNNNLKNSVAFSLQANCTGNNSIQFNSIQFNLFTCWLNSLRANYKVSMDMM
jgi:hypothetical protein